MKDAPERPADALVERLYQELHRLADRAMGRERSSHTLQPTALVNEAWMRLASQGLSGFDNEQHFQALAATMMRRVLVDHARSTRREKRGGGQRPVTLMTDAPLAEHAAEPDLLVLDEALAELALLSPRQASIVELRYFGGQSAAEAAAALDISERTLHREWSLARAWLRRRLEG